MGQLSRQRMVASWIVVQASLFGFYGCGSGVVAESDRIPIDDAGSDGESQSPSDQGVEDVDDDPDLDDDSSAPSSPSDTYYVSTEGSDENRGSLEEPFRTIARAATAVEPGGTVYVASGVYREAIAPTSSGVDGKPIRFLALPGESVVLTGTEPVVDWVSESENVYSAPVSFDLASRNQVFIDGKPGRAARFPNASSDDVFEFDTATINGGSANSMSADGLDGRNDDYWAGGYAWISGQWTTESSRIESSTGNSVSFSSSLGAAAPTAGRAFFISHVAGELDSPGEWFHDGERLHVFVSSGEDPNSLLIEAKAREWCIDLRGRDHIIVSGFSFFGCSVSFEDSSHNTVEKVHGEYIHHDIQLQAGYAASLSGVILAGNHNVLRDSKLRYSSGNLVYVVGNDNALINNHLSDADYLGSYDSAIKLGGERNLVSHNTALRTGRDVLSNFALSRGPPMSDCVVQYNDFSESNLLSNDGGAIYFVHEDGNGTQIHHNWTHDTHERGIYLDNNTSNFIVHHNTVWNCEHIGLTHNIPSNFNITYQNMVDGDFEATYAHMYIGDTYGVHVFDNVFVDGARSVGDILMENNTTVGFDRLANGTDVGYREVPREGVVALRENPYRRNRIENSSFDPGLGLSGWAVLGDETAVRAFSRTTDPMTDATGPTRTTYGSLELQPAQCGVEQRVMGLEPNTTYEIAGWARNPNDLPVRFGVRRADQDLTMSVGKTGNYPESVYWGPSERLRFTTREQEVEVVVFVERRAGMFEVYIDDFSLFEVR